MATEQDRTGEFASPGGFVFGVQGFTWGEVRPHSITFFLDGHAQVADQHGRPIRGTVVDGRPVYFARLTHARLLEELAREWPHLDWQGLACAGWPQLPYADLKKLRALPPTPVEELRKIADPAMRKDALHLRREVDDAARAAVAPEEAAVG